VFATKVEFQEHHARFNEYPPQVLTQRDRDNYDAAEEATWD
jgi:hypothetical protein